MNAKLDYPIRRRKWNIELKIEYTKGRTKKTNGIIRK